MKTKYFLSFLAIIISVFSLIACGGGGGGDDPDPSIPWLCFSASADSTVSTKTNIVGTVSSAVPALEYSKNDGTTWYDFELAYYDGDDLVTAGTTVALASGEKMYIRAKGTNAAFSDFVNGSNVRVISFLLTGTISASGNIMSLLDKSCESKTIPNNGCFYALFYNCTSLTSAPELPATTLSELYYLSMFAECTSLTDAPVLPAKTLAYGCYAEMFYNCTSLTAAPELPATTLTESCYFAMFNSCASLIAAPELLATTLAAECYKGMFQGCLNLNSITVHFEAWTPADATADWVDGVAASGTFTCPAGLIENGDPLDPGNFGDSKVHDGWTIHELP